MLIHSYDHSCLIDISPPASENQMLVVCHVLHGTFMSLCDSQLMRSCYDSCPNGAIAKCHEEMDMTDVIVSVDNTSVTGYMTLLDHI